MCVVGYMFRGDNKSENQIYRMSDQFCSYAPLYFRTSLLNLMYHYYYTELTIHPYIKILLLHRLKQKSIYQHQNMNLFQLLIYCPYLQRLKAEAILLHFLLQSCSMRRRTCDQMCVDGKKRLDPGIIE